MANQIAANFAHHPAEQAAAEVAGHIRSFWSPMMRRELLEGAASEEYVLLSPLVLEACDLLRQPAAP